MKRTEGKITSINRQEINEAIAANNHELVVEVLEGFDFVKDDIPSHFGKSQYDIAESVLTAAIIAAERGVLADDTAVTIISYLTASVNFALFLCDFSFCRPDTQNYACSDESIGNLLASIKACVPSVIFAEEIENLSSSYFLSFLNTLRRADGLKLHQAYCSPLLARIYREDMLSKPTFFALMLRHLQAPSTLPDLIGIIPDGGPFGFMSLLSSLLGKDENKGEADDDNASEKDDSSDDDNKRDCHNHCGGCCGECHGGCGGGCGCRSEKK